MRASEERAFDKRRADAARLVAGAKALRHSAVQAGYAGLRGTYVGIAVAAMLDDMAHTLDQVPSQLRGDGLAVVRFQLEGPDGPNDPRTTGWAALTDGSGH